MIDRLDWDRWLMMGMIGITIGIVGFLLHQALHFIGSIKWYRASQLLRDVSNTCRHLSLVRSLAPAHALRYRLVATSCCVTCRAAALQRPLSSSEILHYRVLFKPKTTKTNSTRSAALSRLSVSTEAKYKLMTVCTLLLGH